MLLFFSFKKKKRKSVVQKSGENHIIQRKGACTLKMHAMSFNIKSVSGTCIRCNKKVAAVNLKPKQCIIDTLGQAEPLLIMISHFKNYI